MGPGGGLPFVTCEKVQELIHAYIDGELDLVNNLEIEGHLSGCEACQSEYRGHLNLVARVQQGAEYFAAGDILRKQIKKQIQIGASERTVGAARRGRPRLESCSQNSRLSILKYRMLNGGRPRSAAPTIAIAATVILGTALLLWAIYFARSQSHNDNLLAQEVVSSHIRSMMLNHLVDVPSSDQHTVKPWFNGKLDFAPDVKDLADQGFPLVGGRLDYIDNRTVAALIYQRRKHAINLFIWPAQDVTNQPAQNSSVNGYNIIHWTRSGTRYWAVSDVNSADLSEFAKLVSQ
jgi:anti-sigma factor RsiW